ncbi:hypothetical protein C5167_003893 [Papaver somniferum]|uniref:Uncharacterized protein n=1 Tax=Papaver somniferum TaxID=3469 RepID=A0A4Y7KXE5_PAPSO|nr:hypothetical protein C5167_003893 [Papaver somniferum]
MTSYKAINPQVETDDEDMDPTGKGSLPSHGAEHFDNDTPQGRKEIIQHVLAVASFKNSSIPRNVVARIAASLTMQPKQVNSRSANIKWLH